MYIALFVPVAMSKSIYISGIVAYQQIHGPILFTLAGILGAIVFFIGYMILLNEYPFAILKTKADVIEGPLMEYAAKYRAYVYITRGFLMFVLASIFTTLFLGNSSKFIQLDYTSNNCSCINIPNINGNYECIFANIHL